MRVQCARKQSQAALPHTLRLHLHKRQEDEVVSPRHRCYSYLRAAAGGGRSRFSCQDSGTRLLRSSLPSRSSRRPAAPPFAIARYTSCPFALWGFFCSAGAQGLDSRAPVLGSRHGLGSRARTCAFVCSLARRRRGHPHRRRESNFLSPGGRRRAIFLFWVALLVEWIPLL